MAKLTLLDGIPEFVATAESGSFSAAAKLLATSVAHVSRKVGTLERRLEQLLLQRTARGCVLNEAGQQFYKQCRTLLDGMEEAHDEARLGRAEIKGNIKISLAGHFAETTVLPLLADFTDRHPNIQLFVNVIARNVDLVGEGVDLSIRLGPLADSTLIARHLITFPGRTLIAPELKAQASALVSPLDLDPSLCLPLVGRPWHFKRRDAAHVLQPRGRLGSDNGLALVAAACRGLGAIQVPSYYGVEEIRRGELVPLFEDWHSGEAFEFFLVFPPTRYIPERVRALAAFLQERLSH
ncbi:LysR family transcriptional regulator [Pseudomonas sp. RIT-To-2]|uniref:LysR family transcriptional regulator n=1 Tax=Pseudomonas sp. RIT-To-2 TaxID=3462541 RepID=UPI0024137C83